MSAATRVTPTHWQILSALLVDARVDFRTPDGKTIVTLSGVRFRFDEDGRLVRVTGGAEP